MSATSSSLPSSAAAANANNENVMETSTNSLRNSKSSSKQTASSADKLGVCLQGYLKKQKTMKKKYFVLVSNNGEKPARLEYYDSEKKFRSRFGHPKRSIVLKSCFHISQRLDTKQKFVIALYTREDSFCIVMENEPEMIKWLDALQTLRQHEESEVDLPRTTFGKCNELYEMCCFIFLLSVFVSIRFFENVNKLIHINTYTRALKIQISHVNKVKVCKDEKNTYYSNWLKRKILQHSQIGLYANAF